MLACKVDSSAKSHASFSPHRSIRARKANCVLSSEGAFRETARHPPRFLRKAATLRSSFLNFHLRGIATIPLPPAVPQTRILFYCSPLRRAVLLDNGIQVIRSLPLGASSKASKGPKTKVTTGQRQACRETLVKLLLALLLEVHKPATSTLYKLICRNSNFTTPETQMLSGCVPK